MYAALFFLSYVALAAPTTEILFSQPNLPGIEGNFFIRQAPGPGDFRLVQWQTNPFTGKDESVPVKWGVYHYTGLATGAPRARFQAGNRDAINSCAAQIKDDTIGIFLNSNDYVNADCQPSCKVNTMLAHRFLSPIDIFENPENKLEISIRAKVPSATVTRPAHSFVNVRLRFEDRNTRRKISYGINLFSLNSQSNSDVVGIDPPTGDIMCNTRFLENMKFVTLSYGSAVARSDTFSRFERFHAFITYENFKAALVQANQMPEASGISINPTDYRLVQTHVEPEMTGTSVMAPATLGASFREFQVSKISGN